MPVQDGLALPVQFCAGVLLALRPSSSSLSEKVFLGHHGSWGLQVGEWYVCRFFLRNQGVGLQEAGTDRVRSRRTRVGG